MNYIERLAFKAALVDLWEAGEDADPEPVFARQGLAIVVADRRPGPDVAFDWKTLGAFVDLLIRDSGFTVTVKERIDGPTFEAIDVEDIRRFAEEYFDE